MNFLRSYYFSIRFSLLSCSLLNKLSVTSIRRVKSEPRNVNYTSKFAGRNFVSINFDYAYYFLTSLLTYSLTHSMKQSASCEANESSDSQDLISILWNPKVHHRIYTFPPPVPILSRDQSSPRPPFPLS
jgi:hypothetical protein